MSKNSFRYFKTSPEVIRPAAMMCVRFPLSLRNVEDLLHERGVDVCHETVRFRWNRFGPMFAAEIRRRRAEPGYPQTITNQNFTAAVPPDGYHIAVATAWGEGELGLFYTR